MAESHSDHRYCPHHVRRLIQRSPRHGENQLPDGGARVSINE
jgi:hypothetical protein